MKKNTVNLSLEDYNYLRDFKQNILDGKCLYVKYVEKYDPFYCGGGYHLGSNEYFLTKDKVIKALAEENEKLSNSLNKQQDVVFNQRKHISDISKMSYWKFRKWKKSHKS